MVLLGEGGPEAVTMEGVAARAGVSKALGYRYFDNADDLLLAVHHREMAVLEQRVTAALVGATGFEERVRASLTAWFDVLAERGTVLATITQARQVQGRIEARSRRAHEIVSEFYGRMAVESFGLSPRLATTAASVLIAGLDGLLDCWTTRRMPRRELVDTYTALVHRRVRVARVATTGHRRADRRSLRVRSSPWDARPPRPRPPTAWRPRWPCRPLRGRPRAPRRWAGWVQRCRS